MVPPSRRYPATTNGGEQAGGTNLLRASPADKSTQLSRWCGANDHRDTMLFGKRGDLRLDTFETFARRVQFRDQRQQNARGEFIEPLGIHLSTSCDAVAIVLTAQTWNPIREPKSI